MAMITAGTWLLESTIEEASTELFFPNEKPESVFLPDKRVLVDPKEFAPGGRYRCKWIFHLEVAELRIHRLVDSP